MSSNELQAILQDEVIGAVWDQSVPRRRHFAAMANWHSLLAKARVLS
jgi:hypothetical protein